MRVCFVFLGIALAGPLSASPWSVQPFIGVNQLGDTNIETTGIGSVDGESSVKLDRGFTAGLALAYQISAQWSTEFAWDYRSAESSVNLADGSNFPEGNWASNLFYVNGRYHFTEMAHWYPYLGAGLVLAQEIDIDLERDGVEQSYSGSGDLGMQVVGGFSVAIGSNVHWNVELRYANIEGVTMEGEEGAAGSIEADYSPVAAQIGLVWTLE